eukprot:6216696-Amphidinium_carterae.6
MELEDGFEHSYELSSGLAGLGVVLYKRGENQPLEHWAARAPCDLLEPLENDKQPLCSGCC